MSDATPITSNVVKDDGTLKRQSEMLAEENIAVLERLRQQGATPNPLMILQLRFETLLDAVLPDGGVLREAHDVMLESRVAAVLEGAESALIREKLMRGVHVAEEPLPFGGAPA